jgi:hypothetical protein
MFAHLASLLFYSRDYAHRAHLAANRHATHVILDEFYKALTPMIDALVETYQGRNGILPIPQLVAEDDLANPGTVLRSHLAVIETIDLGDRALDAILDEICGLYLRTLYKLTNLN